MKLCKVCMLEQPLGEFNKNTSKKDGHQDKCRRCTKLYYSKYYRESPKESDRLYTRNKKERLRRKVVLDDLKDKPCHDCGVKYHPYVMDFDHISDNKSFSISEKRWLNISEMMKEIEKCDLVCANCHRIRTFKAGALFYRVGK